jgi:twinkle protein
VQTLLEAGIRLRNETVGQHAAPCPQCAPTRRKKNAPCLSVFIEADGNAYWNCHHCTWSGSLRDGVNARSNPKGWKEDEYKRPKLINEEFWTAKAKQFFQERKIGDEVLIRNRVQVYPDVWIPQLEEKHNAIAFPFFRRGECINIKYRGPNKNFRLEAGAEKIFYGLDDLVREVTGGIFEARDSAIIVEGEMDKLALEMIGYINVISTPNGAPPENAKNLDRYFDFIEASNYKLNPEDKEGLLDKINTFYIAVDSDGPGRKLEDELIRRLGPDRCVRVRWPKHDGKQLKDANDVLMYVGPDALREAVRSAKPVPLSGVFQVSDFEDKLQDYYEKGLPPGLSTGWESMTDTSGKDIYSLQTGTLTLVTGIPGCGKSSFIGDLSIHAAKLHDWSFAIFSPETQPLQLNASLLMEQYVGLPFNTGYQTRMDPESFELAKKFVQDHYYFLLPEDDLFTVDDILKRAETLVRRHGIKGLIIDPWNNVYHSRPSGEREDEYIGRSLRKINQWKRKWDVWVCIAAHPYKMEPVRGKDPVPTPYNIKGGSEWFDMTDFCLTVWRNKMDENEPSQVHVQKVKFRHLGALGMAEFHYDKPTGKFYDTGSRAEGVKVKRTNSDTNPIFSQDHMSAHEESRWWVD